MEFHHCEAPPTEEQIAAFERELGLTFPRSLKEHYLRANGGSPDPYVYEDEDVDTVVSRCLPLRRGSVSAVGLYEDLVLGKSLVPRHLFPLALDGGGDVFFVETTSEDARVYLWHHDTAFEPLVPLNVGLDEFWSRLKADE